MFYIWKTVESEENFNTQPKKKTKHRQAPTIKTEGPTYSSRRLNRPCMAFFMKMMMLRAGTV
jgi:hypothetical protein